MPSVRISRAASNDLQAIQSFGVEHFGPATTRAFMAGFDRIFARLEHYPLAGAIRPEYGPGVRACLHRPYRVLYRDAGGVVSIVRVLHSAKRPHPVEEVAR